MPAGTEHLIVLVHGIRDPGFWQDDLKAHFERHPHTSVVTAKTDVVDLFRFLSPIVAMRRRPVERIKSVIENAIAAHKDAEVTIIAHSFGTWMVSKILHEDTNIAIDRLVLCGAIVPNDFRWDRVQKINLRNRRRSIVNEYSPLDFWPLTAKVTTYGYGNTGSRGIGDAGVTDRRHSIPHAGYLNTEFARRYWDPFIYQNKIVAADTQPVRAPWYFVLTRIPFNYMTMGLLLLAVFCTAVGFYAISYTGNLEIALLSYRKALIQTADGGEETRFPQFRFTTKERNIEVFLHVDQRDGDRLKAHTIAPADNVEIEVSTRPPIVCGEDEADIPWTDHRTTYQISYVRQSWWRNILDRNWQGTVELELDYDPGKAGDTEPDVLKIDSVKGVQPGTRIAVKPEHNPDNCLDADPRRSAMVVIVPTEFASAEPGGWWNWLSGISIARAADKAGQVVKELLGSRDRTSRAIAIEQIQRSPELLKEGLSGVLDPNANANQIGDVLTGLVQSNSAEVIFSPEVLEPVFELTWSDDAGKRAAARRFLSTEMVARRNVTARFRTAIEANWNALVGRYVKPGNDPFAEKRYLALIALRDVHYNGALFRFDQVIDLAATGRLDEEIDTVVKMLAEGEALADIANPRTRYAFAKNTYGRALSLFRYARVKLALAEGVAAKDPSQEAIRTDLIRFERENRPIPLRRFRAGEAQAAFQKFLADIAGNEARYIWPHHIAQARACTALRDALPADCLNSTE